MEILKQHQINPCDFLLSHAFNSKREKQRENYNKFFNKVVNNFKDGDWTSLFTFFGSEFNNAKHTALIPFDLALAKLNNAIDKETARLPKDFKFVWNPEYKYNPLKKTWRLHFHLISNYPLKILYSGENREVHNIENLASYLSKSFILSTSNNIPLYLFSPNCVNDKEIIKERQAKIISTILLYSINKNNANYKQKVKEVNNYCSDLFRPLIFNIPPRCRGSPAP